MNLFDNLDDNEWDLAGRAVSAIGTPPSLFTAAIRAIRNAPTILQGANDDALQKFSVSAALFPVKVSPTLKTSLYFALGELYPEKLEDTSPLTPQRLLSCFSPSEIAAIMSLTLLTRSVKAKCAQDEWSKIEGKMTEHLSWGAAVGATVPSVGVGNGMLIAGMRYICLAILLALDLKRFKELRRSMERKKDLFLTGDEQRIFRCTHLHIASCLVSSLGYGVGPRLAFGIQEPPDADNLRSAIQEAQEEIDAWRIAMLMMESLHAEAPLPSLVTARQPALFEEGKFKALLKRERENIRPHQWLFRSRRELPPEIMLQLDIKPDNEDDQRKESSATA